MKTVAAKNFEIRRSDRRPYGESQHYPYSTINLVLKGGNEVKRGDAPDETQTDFIQFSPQTISRISVACGRNARNAFLDSIYVPQEITLEEFLQFRQTGFPDGSWAFASDGREPFMKVNYIEIQTK